MFMLIIAAAFVLAGIALLIVPIHMQMTGIVLILLGCAIGGCHILGIKGRFVLLTQLIIVCAAVCVIALMACMNLVTAGGQSDWENAEQSDYAIVLGAAVREDGKASRIMRSRLRAAVEFMEKNPHAIVILSGGQGDDEPESEAQCMYDTIASMGADMSRVLTEDESHTTRENLINSMKIIEARGGTDEKITLITSEFHQRRAKYIAESLEIDTCGVAARTDQWFYRVNYTLREVFAFVKASIQGGMD